MTFYPENVPLPEKLQIDPFVICPLTPAHVGLDYAALMSNKEMLRLWSGSSWPSDNFTLTENLADLEWHWSEHQERIAFTYTILNPSEDACLGCIYIKSFTEILVNNPEWLKTVTEPVEVTVSNHSALVRFWTINNRDKTLLPILQQWFATKWAFPEIFWHISADNQPQLTVFQNSGLTSLGYIRMPERGGNHLLYK